MKAAQWFGLLVMLAMFGGLVWAYLREAVTIEPDDVRKTEDWPRTTQGGS